MIKTIVFDLGGVIFAQSFEGAIRHFALESHHTEIARLMKEFLKRVVNS